MNSQSTTTATSFIIFSSISVFAAVSSLCFFSTTTFYTTYFTSYGNPFICIFSSTFSAFHFILIFFHSQLRNIKILNGKLINYIAMPVLFFTCFTLYLVPESSVSGLWFVIFLWIDVNALVQILKPRDYSKHLRNQIVTVIITRTISLYGFTGTYWKIMLFCSSFIYVMSLYHDQTIVGSSEKSEEKREIM